MIKIDGSLGEGGGQMIRSSLSLSAITGEEVSIQNVRANRAKPGLLRQHLTALNAVTEICGGSASGAELGAREISLKPGKIRGGDYHFSVGSAGSANLVLQTILPVLLHADVPSNVHIKGGTHNSKSPPFEFLSEGFIPCLRRMGFDCSVELISYGFYPAGGGEILAKINPSSGEHAFDQVDRGEERSRSIEVLIAHLRREIANREIDAAAELLGLDSDNTCKISFPASSGPGNVIYGRLGYDFGTILFAQFGDRGVPAERIGKKLAKQMQAFVQSGAAIDPYLADQLLLPMALAQGGTFSSLPPTHHFVSNAEIITKFLGGKIAFQADGNRAIISVRG